MARSMRGLGGGMVAAVALLPLAAAPPAGAAERLVLVHRDGCESSPRTQRGALHPGQPGRAPCRTAPRAPPAPSSAGRTGLGDDPRPHACEGRRAVARVRERRVALLWTATRTPPRWCARGGRPVPRGRAGRLEQRRRCRGLRIDGGAPFDAVGPRTITLADGTRFS